MTIFIFRNDIHLDGWTRLEYVYFYDLARDGTPVKSAITV